MNWCDEPYVRVYRRNTVDTVAWGHEARGVCWDMLRAADRSGVIELGKHGLRGLAVLIHWPVEIVERAIPVLVADGVLRMSEHAIVFPNYLAAQEAPKSDAARKREERERKREQTMADVTKRDEESRAVQPSGQDRDRSHEMSLLPSVPSLPSVQGSTETPADADDGATAPEASQIVLMADVPKRDEIAEVWEHFLAGRSKRRLNGAPSLDTWRKHVRARIARYGAETVNRASDSLWANDWMIANGHTDPSQVFGSNEKLEKRLAEANKPSGGTTITKTGGLKQAQWVPPGGAA